MTSSVVLSLKYYNIVIFDTEQLSYTYVEFTLSIVMAVRVVEFSSGGYKIGKSFA